MADTRAAFQLMKDHDTHSYTLCTTEIHRILKKLADKDLSFQWILGRCGIHGNEEADQLENSGSELQPAPLVK